MESLCIQPDYSFAEGHRDETIMSMTEDGMTLWWGRQAPFQFFLLTEPTENFLSVEKGL